MKKNIFLLLLSLFWQANVFAQVADGIYTLQIQHNGQCVAVAGASKDNGAGVVQWDNVKQPDIFWIVRKQANGTYTFTNRNSGKALAVAGADKNTGGKVVQWDNINQADVFWRIEAKANGYYALVNNNSNKVLDVIYGNKALGTGLQQWDYNGGGGQHFRFVLAVDESQTQVYTLTAKDIFDELINKGYSQSMYTKDGTQNPAMIYDEAEGTDIKLYAKPLAGGDAFSVRVFLDMRGQNLENSFTYEGFYYETRGNKAKERECTYEVREAPAVGSTNLKHSIFIKAKNIGWTGDDRAILWLKSFRIRGAKNKNWRDAIPVSALRIAQQVMSGNNSTTIGGGNNSAMTSLADTPRVMLEQHNFWRTQLGIAPVTWSVDLEKFAQEWANEIVRTGKIVHRNPFVYGECLYWAFGANLDAKGAMGFWAGERKNFDHNTQTCKDGTICGHYTQVIWEKTTQIGCASAVMADGSVVWVCNYNPPGNYTGEKPYIKK